MIKEGLKDLPPFSSAALRFILAAVCMVPITALLWRKEGGDNPPAWLWMAQGCTNFAASYGIVYWAETRLPSGLVALLWAVFPLMMAVIGHFLLPGERMRRSQVSGLLIGFCGLYLLFALELPALSPQSLRDGAILLLSPAVAAIGTVLVKRYGASVSSLKLNRNSLAFATLPLTILALSFEREETFELSSTALFSILYLAIVGTCLTFGIYFWLMRSIPASQMSLIAYVIPAIALSLGSLIGGERVTIWMILGGALILLGVGIARR